MRKWEGWMELMKKKMLTFKNTKYYYFDTIYAYYTTYLLFAFLALSKEPLLLLSLYIRISR